MHLLVCGGRTYRDRELLFAKLDQIHAARPISLIIQGGQKDSDPFGEDFRGADYLAKQWAEAREVPCLRVPARWKGLGHKCAGPIRNA